VKKIDTLEVYIKFGTKLFYLTWEKKRWNVRHVMGKVKKNVDLRVLGMVS
jgi:hypothetical protein